MLDELPPGRQKTDTFLVNETYRGRLNGFLRQQVQAGHQCYVVCPSVEEGETESGKAAQAWAETLQQRVFPDLQVGLLHGRMKGPEKEAVMGEFARGKIQILVATTVIEVGVDVPNATVMVVEDADRFGLSQLHQLRGRVGRGQAKSYCILLSNNRNPDTQARLKTLCKTGDGFRIAEEDLQLRGPGGFLWTPARHGLPTFRAASLSMDVGLLQQAQTAALSGLISMEMRILQRQTACGPGWSGCFGMALWPGTEGRGGLPHCRSRLAGPEIVDTGLPAETGSQCPGLFRRIQPYLWGNDDDVVSFSGA